MPRLSWMRWSSPSLSLRSVTWLPHYSNIGLGKPRDSLGDYPAVPQTRIQPLRPSWRFCQESHVSAVIDWIFSSNWSNLQQYVWSIFQQYVLNLQQYIFICYLAAQICTRSMKRTKTKWCSRARRDNCTDPRLDYPYIVFRKDKRRNMGRHPITALGIDGSCNSFFHSINVTMSISNKP
jgi:hypothetical protein